MFVHLHKDRDRNTDKTSVTQKKNKGVNRKQTTSHEKKTTWVGRLENFFLKTGTNPVASPLDVQTRRCNFIVITERERVGFNSFNIIHIFV